MIVIFQTFFMHIFALKFHLADFLVVYLMISQLCIGLGYQEFLLIISLCVIRSKWVKSLALGDGLWHWKTGSALVQVMACCNIASSSGQWVNQHIYTTQITRCIVWIVILWIFIFCCCSKNWRSHKLWWKICEGGESKHKRRYGLALSKLEGNYYQLFDV